ncbi:MAG: SPOR domain-containing protein [Gammaproteobacteria bacterium]|nr:SPOR domain-containing protein [Gammaproteobacteria bacterium]MDX5375585.1 SPOR domain-containing protein [Gammaproteobacteria bacterium]
MRTLCLSCLSCLLLATTPVAAMQTHDWDADTRIQQADGTESAAQPDARALRLTRGIAELSTRHAPVTVDTPRLRVELTQGRAWLRAEDERVSVWLIEGRGHIDHPTSGRVSLDLPMTFVEARGDTAPTPPLPVSQARARAWSAALPGSSPPAAIPIPIATPAATPAATPGNGPWALQAASLATAGDAEREAQRLQAAGIPAQVSPAEVEGVTRYRVRIHGFHSRTAAKTYAQARQDALGRNEPWVVCTTGDC